VFGAEEVALWSSTRGGLWMRKGSRVRLRVAESAIMGAGRGLFTTAFVDAGVCLGRMSGGVLLAGTLGKCEDEGIRRACTHAMALRYAAGWALVDVGAPFRFVNCSTTPNVSVSAAGWVVSSVAVAARTELVFDYGGLFCV